jgi:hypothetical protein
MWGECHPYLFPMFSTHAGWLPSNSEQHAGNITLIDGIVLLCLPVLILLLRTISFFIYNNNNNCHGLTESFQSSMTELCKDIFSRIGIRIYMWGSLWGSFIGISNTIDRGLFLNSSSFWDKPWPFRSNQLFHSELYLNKHVVFSVSHIKLTIDSFFIVW